MLGGPRAAETADVRDAAPSFGDATSETTRGAGFRYTIARALGLDVGIDWAEGPNDHAFCLQVGSASR